MDPFAEINDKLKEMEGKLRVAIETAILRESVYFELGRLAQLDTDRAPMYESAAAAIGKNE
jgi:hypothetical protein